VAADGRVLRKLLARPYPQLPRIWVDRSTDDAIDAQIEGDAAAAVQAVAPLRTIKFPARVLTAGLAGGELTLQLGSGQRILLGDARDLRLKLAVAAQILRLASGSRYLDVSVPDRAVAGFNPQVSG